MYANTYTCPPLLPLIARLASAASDDHSPGGSWGEGGTHGTGSGSATGSMIKKGLQGSPEKEFPGDPDEIRIVAPRSRLS